MKNKSNIRQRLISLVLVFTLIALIPFTVTAAASDFEIKDGVLTKYNGNATSVIIPDGVTEIGKDCFAYNADISTVIIPSSVKTLAQGAFYECENLQTIVVPASVTAIGDYALDSNDFVTIYCEKDSAAYKYATGKKIKTSTYSPVNTVKEATLKPFANLDLTVAATNIAEKYNNESTENDGKPTTKTFYYHPGATLTFNQEVDLWQFGWSVIDVVYKAGAKIDTYTDISYCLVLNNDGSLTDLNNMEYMMNPTSKNLDDSKFILWFVPFYLNFNDSTSLSPVKDVTVVIPATAVPSAQKVTVNGKDVAFDAYNINGNNYFKLRDLAYILSGTQKQFEVGWDGAKNAISLTSGKSYTSDGSEMKSKGAGSQTANPTTSKIYLDGKEISLTAYNIGGNKLFQTARHRADVQLRRNMGRREKHDCHRHKYRLYAGIKCLHTLKIKFGDEVNSSPLSSYYTFSDFAYCSSFAITALNRSVSRMGTKNSSLRRKLFINS